MVVWPNQESERGSVASFDLLQIPNFFTPPLDEKQLNPVDEELEEDEDTSVDVSEEEISDEE